MARNNTENKPVQEVKSNEKQDAPVQLKKLKIEVAFTDKYNGKDYKVGDVIEVEENRFNELINDPRKLVSESK